MPQEGSPPGPGASTTQNVLDQVRGQCQGGDTKMKAKADLKDLERDVEEAWRVAEMEEDL